MPCQADPIAKQMVLRWRCSRKYGTPLICLAAVTFALATLNLFRPLGPRTKVKVIGYACTHSCGGWGDRQKGIVTSYIMATLLGVEFKLYMPYPCDVRYFLSPTAEVNWTLHPQELEELNGRKVLWIHETNTLDVVQNFMNAKYPLEMYDAEYVFLTTNMEAVHLLRTHGLAQGVFWLQEQTIPEIYRTVLTKLFALMPGPQLILNHFWNSLPPHTKLICAQIRAGGAGDTDTFNTAEHLSGLIRFLAPYNHSSFSSSSSSSSPYRFLFTSDKAFMLKLVQSYFPSLYVEMEGPVTHVDLSTGNDVCGGYRRAIVEQQLLRDCHVLVMSESGFSKIAAFFRNTDENLFIFHDGIVEGFKRDQQFPNRRW